MLKNITVKSIDDHEERLRLINMNKKEEPLDVEDEEMDSENSGDSKSDDDSQESGSDDDQLVTESVCTTAKKVIR